MDSLRIVSFLPAATEMVCALGLADDLVGISHECDHPPEVRSRPVIVRPAIPLDGLSQREIDERVTRRLREGMSLYAVDEIRLRELAPDLILTQDLCQVCAPSGNEITQTVKSLPKKPRILSLTPKSLDGIFENLREIGRATGRLNDAEALIADSRARLNRVAAATRHVVRPRVFCMEWLDPVYCSGHWAPEMVDLAGGVDSLGRKGADSVRIPWEDVRQWAPELLILMPCGYRLDKVLELAPQIFANPGWADLPAVQHGRVYAVDANSYFARPGPRVVEGTELLAHLIHPELFSWNGPAHACARIAQATAPR
jgi:iron complex transport system substrate-binding protein